MHRAGHSPAAAVAAGLAAPLLATSRVRSPASSHPGPAPHGTSYSSAHAGSAPTLSYVAQFDTLWTRFDAVYPSFAYKHVDWRAQRAKYRPRAERARSENELVAVLLAMLAPLRDLHNWLGEPRGEVGPS